jgi:hypothetical protein
MGDVVAVGRNTVCRARDRDLDLEIFGGSHLYFDGVPEIQGHEEAFEFVIAIGPAAHDPKPKINLGGSKALKRATRSVGLGGTQLDSPVPLAVFLTSLHESQV